MCECAGMLRSVTKGLMRHMCLCGPLQVKKAAAGNHCNCQIVSSSMIRE